MENRYLILSEYLKKKSEFEVRYNLVEDEPETGSFVTNKGITRNDEIELLNEQLAEIENKNNWIYDILSILEGYYSEEEGEHDDGEDESEEHRWSNG